MSISSPSVTLRHRPFGDAQSVTVTYREQISVTHSDPRPFFLSSSSVTDVTEREEKERGREKNGTLFMGNLRKGTLHTHITSRGGIDVQRRNI
jgi:hypothetical protein